VRLPGWLVAVGLAALLVWTWQRAERREGALDQQVKAREAVIAALAKQKAKVDTQYLKAKPVYIAAVQGWDSLKLTLGDKVKIDPVVLAGDKVVGACTTLLALCDERNRLTEQQLAEQRAQTETWKAKARGPRILGIPRPRISAGFNVGKHLHIGIPLF
jgi:hypothetical protein